MQSQLFKTYVDATEKFSVVLYSTSPKEPNSDN